MRLPGRQWVDLFYDLAIAAGIIALSGSFSSDHSAMGALWFAVTYAVMGCLWFITSALTGAYSADPPGPSAGWVALVVVQLALVLLLPVAAGDELAAADAVFDLLLGGALVVSVVLALRGPGRGPARSGPVAGLLAGAAVVLGGSWWAQGPATVIVWLLSLALVGAAVGILASSRGMDPHRVAHRLGELTIVVLGEILVKLVLTLAEESLASVSVAGLAATFAVLILVWWGYFGLAQAGADLSRSARRLVWVVAHFPFHLGLLALAVGLAKASVGSSTLTEHGAWWALLVAPAGLSIGALVVLRRAAHPAPRPPEPDSA